MNKKGFTLVELLAVLVILAVIALIVFPIVGDVINDSKEKSFIRSVEGLERAVELDYQDSGYKGDRTYQYENGNLTLTNVNGVSKNENIKVEGIIQNGVGNVYVDSEGDVEIKIWNDDLGKCAEKSLNDHTIKITDTIEVLCSIDNVTLPIITLNGDTNMTITEGETFTDPGYTATYKGVDITNDVQVLGSVDTSVAGTYTLTYNVSYNGKEAEPVERVVNVICPNVTIMGKSIQTCETANLDPDQNLRYVGPSPNNYVSFNGELWRVIGVFDGQAKIIRDAYYTSIYWDASYNNWAEADLKKTLNGTYLSSIQTNDPTSYGYIDLEHVWNIGAYDSTYTTTGTRSAFYTAERSETPAGASGSESTWTGAIGLMYPSDYGYASSGSTETCEGKEMYKWDTGDYKTECAENSWLYDSSDMPWTITPRSDDSNYVFVVTRRGPVYSDYVSVNYPVQPVLYLKSDTKIVGGLGTYDQPYTLGT